MKFCAKVVLFAAAVALLPSFARPAIACTCMRLDPRAQLKKSDAAFVGTLIAKSRATTGRAAAYESDYRYEVTAVLKGNLAREVVVRSATDGATCGLTSRGEPVGLFLSRGRDGWKSGLCEEFEPADLTSVRATTPHATPTLFSRSSGSFALPVAGAAALALAVAISLKRMKTRPR